MNHIITKMLRILAIIFITFLMISCQSLEPKTDNLVVSFLEDAELQIETLNQVQELEKALQDILLLPPEQLRKKRYSDYQMNERAWTLPKILSSYFCSHKPLFIDVDHFYSDLATDVARSTVQKILTNLQSLK